MKRYIRVILLAQLGVGALAMPANAAPAGDLGGTLGRLWTTVLQTPAAQSSFGTGGPAKGCWNFGKIVAPLGPTGVPSCTVEPGTRIFVTSSTYECSTFPGDDGGTAATEEQLRVCARSHDAQTAPPVTLDGQPVAVVAAETSLLHITLPADNIFGTTVPAGTTGTSVAHGWVAQLHPLHPGTHTIVIGSTPPITTTIAVSPRA